MLHTTRDLSITIHITIEYYTKAKLIHVSFMGRPVALSRIRAFAHFHSFVAARVDAPHTATVDRTRVAVDDSRVRSFPSTDGPDGRTDRTDDRGGGGRGRGSTP